MTEINIQEIDALLELIQKKKYELLTDCRAWKRSVKGVLDRDEAQPRNKDERQLGHIPAPNSDLVFKYSSAVEYTDIDFRKTYLDVSEYWEKFYQEYLTAEEYISKVMEVHWFLLYYTHRHCLTNWKKAWPAAIWLRNSNAVSVNEIDTFLNYFLDYWGPLYSRETIQDFMTFAAKSIGAVAPVNIIDIYDDDNLDDSARVDALRALLDSLPFTKGIAFTEVLDSILFTLDQGCYKEILALQKVFCSGIPGDRYLYIQDEFFEKSFNCIKKDLPHVLPPYFEDADALLNGIKQEFAANRDLVDDASCKIIDGWLGLTQRLRPETPANTQLIPEVEEQYRYMVPLDVFDADMRILDDKYYVHNLVIAVTTGDNPVERFQKLFRYVLQWGRVENKADQDAMLTLLTGYYVPGATSKARWCAEEYMPRVLYHIVKHISKSRNKYKPLEYVDFYSDNQQAVNADLRTIREGNTSTKADESVPRGVRMMLSGCYPSLFQKPEE